MEKKILSQLKNKLEEEKKLLEKELNKFAKKVSARPDNWQTIFPKFDKAFGSEALEEASDEVEEYSNLLSLKENLEKRLKDINLALEKIKKGKYGFCQKCQKRISLKKLLISPETKFCQKCQINNSCLPKPIRLPFLAWRQELLKLRFQPLLV